jgi:hypothetical protein
VFADNSRTRIVAMLALLAGLAIFLAGPVAM